MILSLDHRFLFLSNIKTASTSIERVLTPFGQVNLVRSEFGKHFGISEVQHHFQELMRAKPLVFSVIRNPEERLKSLFRSHTDKRFSHLKGVSTLGMSSDEFLHTWIPRHWDQAKPQSARFVGRQGRWEVDFLINFDHLQADFNRVCRLVGIEPIDLPFLNKSPETDIDFAPYSEIIMRQYETDIWLQQEFTGRLITSEDRLYISQRLLQRQ